MTKIPYPLPETPTPELSVIVPCFNEALNIPELTARLLRALDGSGLRDTEVLLIDDGSVDGTALAIRAAQARHPGRVVGCFHPRNRGITEAWRTGVEHSRGRLVATLDADLQYQPEDLVRLHSELVQHGVDIVQGWRSSAGRERDRRYYLSRGLNALLNGVFSMDLHDNKSGFIMCDRAVLQDLLTYSGRYFHWQSFIMVAAHAKGYSYREIETAFEPRRHGQSFLDSQVLKTTARALVDVARASGEYRFRRARPDLAHQFLRRHPVAGGPPQRSPAAALRWGAYMNTFHQTHWMITREVEQSYETLCRTQWLSPAHTRELQDEKLRRMIRHCYRNVPYYRERLRARKLRPEDIQGQADLWKLPLLTKDDIRRNLSSGILSEVHDASQRLRIATSGSTGEPFVCYADRTQLEFRWAATLRAHEWTGYRFGDPTVRLWHQTIGLSRSQAWRERADAVLSNRTFVPVFELQKPRLARMVQLIANANPVFMDGYAEAFDFLAQYLRDEGRLDVRPRAIMSSAQTLPASSRALIESAFGCRVFDKYGSREFSGIAYECDAHDGHHVVAEGYIVEVLVDGRPARPGEVGEVVITDLNNLCLPFIRYRIGDLAEAMDADRPCPCGRGAPRIGAIAGRVQSIIEGTDGQYLPGTFFSHYLKELDHAIRRFQIIQEERGAIRFCIVKGPGFSDDVLQEVLETFRHYLGKNLRIDVETVDNVALVHTGKRVASVTHLKPDFQDHAPVMVRTGTAAFGRGR